MFTIIILWITLLVTLWLMSRMVVRQEVGGFIVLWMMWALNVVLLSVKM